MKTSNIDQFDNLTLAERKIEYLVTAKLRNKDSIKAAIETQNALRAKYHAESEWDSVTQIRNWRERK